MKSSHIGRTLLFFVMMLAVVSMACALLQEPPQPVIPSPPALGTRDDSFVLSDYGELIVDPGAGTVAPGVDPEIATLANQVSQQQLVSYVQTLESFGTRNTFSPSDRLDYGIGAARSWIANEFSRVGNGRLQILSHRFPLTLNGVTTDQENVVAVLPGTSSYPGRVVLMAHYDSRSVDPNSGFMSAPGANDNASGVALMLELARLLSSRDWNQTIVFIAFTAEEQGTHGSRQFLADYLLQGWQVDAALNNDIVGGRPGIPQSIRVFTAGANDPGSPPQRFARYLALIGQLYVPALAVDVQDAIDRPGRYSDHIRFLDAGIPALRLTESVEDPGAQHNANDTSEKLDYGYLVQVARLNLTAIANAAGAPPPPEPPIIAPMADPGAYIVTWRPDVNAAGYAIAFRPLGQAGYPEFRLVSAEDAGNVAFTDLSPTTEYAVSLSALDANGRFSLFSPEVIITPR